MGILLLKKNNKHVFCKKNIKKNSLGWNQFISAAKNATFLFHRDFKEYHKDRFEGFSLMISKEEKLYAVLPVNNKDYTDFFTLKVNLLKFSISRIS